MDYVPIIEKPDITKSCAFTYGARGRIQDSFCSRF